MSRRSLIAFAIFGVAALVLVAVYVLNRRGGEDWETESIAKKDGQTPSHTLDEFCGAFFHPVYRTIDILRKAGRIELHGDDELFDRQISPARSPEDHAVLSSERRWLERALADLNGHQREAIVLCYFEGLSLQEIAMQTSTSLGTVKTRLFYARKILAVVLSESARRAGASQNF